MANDHSTDELLSFLQHASKRGLMPAATAQALAVASRRVFAVLNGAEGSDVRSLNLDDAIKRFTNRRGKEFNPASVKEYARRVRKAVEFFLAWRKDPASLSVKTRNTGSNRAVQPKFVNDGPATATTHVYEYPHLGASDSASSDGYQTSFPIRAGHLITLSNVPQDLTKPEAERFAAFIGMLAVD